MPRRSERGIVFCILRIRPAFLREFSSQGQSIVPYVQSYLEANISYVGGCCHVDPQQIRAMRDVVDAYRS